MCQLAMRARGALLVLISLSALTGCGAGAEDDDQSKSVPVMTTEEAQQILVACLHERGWTEAEYDPADGGVFVELPAEQADLYRADREECREANPYATPEFTLERAKTYYDGLVATAECVRGLGYEVPDIPSEEVSVAGLVDDGDPQWDPFDLVDDIHFVDVQAECPYPVS